MRLIGELPPVIQTPRGFPMRRLFLSRAALAAAAATLSGATASALAQTAAKTRVVVQVSEDDPARWNLALNNVKNLQQDFGAANITVEIVAYGPGIGMLKLESQVASRLLEATNAGVAVNACENTMRGQKLVKADMLANVTYVPAGVVEIVKRQQEGWAYLRP
jgi:intracellular sulfur oxidation DsrE/DsrF family protein